MSEKYSWNPVLKIVLKMKYEYVQNFGLDTYCFENWKERLDDRTYNDFFECLQVNQYNNFILIRYGLEEMQRGMWEDSNSPYRECRSLVIDLENDSIVLSPFRKFFNLNEVDENNVDTIKEKFKTCSTVEVANKLDGSVQVARWYNNEVFMTGSKSLDKENSWRLSEGYSMITDKYTQMLKDNSEYTFIFEYISLKDAHVVLYSEKDVGLHLIGMRNTLNGNQLPYSDVIKTAKIYNVKYVELENISMEQLLEEMKTRPSDEKEGWIINLDGHLIKLKCDDYVSVHRIIDHVSSANVIIESIAEGKFDDLLSKIPDNYKQRVGDIAELVFMYLSKTKEDIKKFYKEAPKGSRKEFMIWIDKNAPKQINSYIKHEYLKREYNLLKKNKEGYKKLSDLGYSKDLCFELLSNNGGKL